MFYKHGPNYFDSIRNWDKEKNKLLEAYGYSLNDDLKGKFEFNYKDGKPYLRVLDNSIKRIVVPVSTSYKRIEEPVEVMEAETTDKEAVVLGSRLGVVFNFNKKGFPYFFS